MSNELDTLLTTLYVELEDRVLPALGWSRAHRPGRKPELSDAELLCLAVAQQLLGVASERRWVRYARIHLVVMFPCLLEQSENGKRLRAAGPLITAVLRELARDTPSWADTRGWWTARHRRALPPGKRSNALTWPGTPATGTARPTPGSSGASGCMC